MTLATFLENRSENKIDRGFMEKSTAAGSRYAKPLVADAAFFETSKPLIASIYRYWQTACGDRAMPRRADFDPMALPRHLPDIVLVDVEGEDEHGHGIFRYRVVGTREVDKRRRDPTGERIETGYFAESQEAALRFYESARILGAPILEPVSFVSPRGIRIEEDNIFLPLSENGTTVSQILAFAESCRPLDVMSQ